MKSTTLLANCIGIALFLDCANSQAADWRERFYLRGDVGPAFVDMSAHLRTFTSPTPTITHGQLKTDTGIRGDLSLGYQLTKSFSIEAEAGAVWNNLSDMDENFYQIPLMLKALYQVPLGKSWHAYIGGGAGEVAGIAKLKEGDAAFHTPFIVQGTDWSFGYEAEAGIKYNLSRRLDLGLGYKFMSVDSFRWASEFHAIGQRIVTTDNVYTHTALLSFIWKF